MNSQKSAKRHEQTFPEKDIQVADKHMKICSTSLAIGEMGKTKNDLPLHTYQNGYKKNK